MKSLKQALIDDICRLVRIPSRSSPEGGEEGELQLLVAERMRAVGARVRTFEANDIPEFREHNLCFGPDRQYKNRPTVIGELGPEDAPALLILAHSDTVQITRPEEWTFDPFCGEVHDGKIYGLGASDDKWGIATMLTIMRALQESENRLDKKLIFASTIDEENGVGNGTLLLALAGITAESALYLDGTQMQVCVGNLGGSFLFLRPKDVIGKEDWACHADRLKSACAELSRVRASAFDLPLFKDNAGRSESISFYETSDARGRYFNVAFYTVPGDEQSAVCAMLEDATENALGDELRQYAMSYLEPWFEPAINPEDTTLAGHVAASVRGVLDREAVITTIVKQDSFVLRTQADISTVSFGPANQVSGPGAFHQPDECLPIHEAWDGCRIAHATVCRWLEE